jgi:signal peptidase
MRSGGTPPESSGQRRRGPLLWGTLLAIFLLVPVVAHFALGIGFSPVLSQSMQPAFSAGDLEITRTMPANEITVGDVVVLHDPEADINYSHRVITVTPDGNDVLVTTKGDANPAVDRNTVIVDRQQTVAAVVTTIPIIGFGIASLTSPQAGTFGFALLGIAALLFTARFAIRKSLPNHQKEIHP